MTIATIGPKKYDFQDLVCLDFVLKTVYEKDISFLIEPHGGEDASFTYRGNGEALEKFEVQVKGSEEPVTMRSIAECLLHFPEREHNNCLFERLLKDNSLFVVLVMSGRATDELLKFLPSGEWKRTPHNDRFTLTDAEELKRELLYLIQRFKCSPLWTKRKAHSLGIIDNFDAKKTKSSLRRLIVIDEVSTDSIKMKLSSTFCSTYRVPDAHIDSTIGKAIDHIKSAKDSQQNVIPLIAGLLREVSQDSIKPLNYVERGDEDAFINSLLEDHFLLLSGKPRVGKSYTARWLASFFQDKGYNVKITSNVFEAFRFLEDPFRESRLVLVDDPLGGSRLENKSSEIWLEIKKKLHYVPSLRRKIIISQGQERVFEISEQDSLDDIMLGSKRWSDLSTHTESFLTTYWNNLQQTHNLPKQLFLTVSDNLNGELKGIELGSLDYLAVEYSKLEPDADVSQIIRFARKNAKDLGDSLKSDGHQKTLVGLALTTSGLDTIQGKELAYVLDNPIEKQYGFTKSIGTSLGFSNEKKYPEFPVYSTELELSDETIDSLEQLEQKRMAHWSDEDCISFTHPFYRSAAESLIKLNSRRLWPNIKQQLSNGIFCLSPTTSKLTAKNLLWIYRASSLKHIKDDIIELAKDGLNSSYPSTRDVCFDLLMTVAHDSQASTQDERSRWLSSISFNSLSHANWHDGYPWYPMGDKVLIKAGIKESLGIFDVPEDAATIVDSLNEDDSFNFTPKDAFDALNYCNEEPHKITALGLMRILSLDEGQIRALGAKVWIGLDRVEDTKVLDRIFSDTHPSVAEAIYKTLITKWEHLSTERRDELISRTQKMITSPIASAIILPEIIKFHKKEVTGTEPPWEVFFKLLPIVLDNVYHSISINYPRLDCAVSKSISACGYENVLPILNSWVGVLETNSGSINGGGYDVAVLRYLLTALQESKMERAKYLVRLLKISKTRPATDILFILVECWSTLSSEEKVLVEEALQSTRTDLVWLKSVVLISPSAAPSLLKAVLGEPTENITFNDLLTLDLETQETALQLYFDRFGALIPLDVSDRDAWQQLIVQIVSDSGHRFYELCFDAMLGYETNDTILSEAITLTKPSVLDKVFNKLLAYAINTTAEYRPLTWSALFENAECEEKKHSWLAKMAESSALYLDTIDEINQWLPERYLDAFYTELKMDDVVVRTTNLLLTETALMNDETLGQFIEIIEKIPPYHHTSCDYLQNALKRLGKKPEYIERVNNVRLEILSKVKEYGGSSIKDRNMWVY